MGNWLVRRMRKRAEQASSTMVAAQTENEDENEDEDSLLRRPLRRKRGGRGSQPCLQEEEKSSERTRQERNGGEVRAENKLQRGIAIDNIGAVWAIICGGPYSLRKEKERDHVGGRGCTSTE